jgi:16S rRNA (guanine527-N7)-methyltransferase
VGKSTINEIWHRHFLDSFQLIDFIDKNDKMLVDLGSGAGFPGIVLSIIAEERKIPLKIKLIEKSPKKINFLKEIISQLKLNADVINKNVFDKEFKFINDVFAARAFKPLPKILELIHSKAKNFKKIIIFLGKSGHKELLQASKKWDIKYKQQMSITSNDSFIIEINKLKKK